MGARFHSFLQILDVNVCSAMHGANGMELGGWGRKKALRRELLRTADAVDAMGLGGSRRGEKE
jgi:hypothetical protein